MTRSSLLRRCGVLFATAATAGAVLLTTAAGGVNAPQSGWYSGNPLLGPNALTSLACAGPTCYASGDFGTLLKSTDGGSAWAGVVTGITTTLQRVRLVGGSADSIVVGGGCAVRRSDDGGDTFSRLPFSASDEACSSGVTAFAFPSANVGYLALANGSVLSTADGGRSFTRRTALPAAPPTDLLCTSDTTCFATAGGSIQRTTDGAVSWTQAATGYPNLKGLEQAGPTTFYAVGDALTVLRSTDSGVTWTPLPVAGTPAGDLASIRCATATICLIATRQGNQILRTADAGLTYTSIVPSSDATHAVAFASATRAVAAGDRGSVEVSGDAGATWAAVGSRVPGTFDVLEAASSSVAYAGGADGVLARTADAGRSWRNVSTPTSAQIVDVAAPTATRLFVLGSDGSLERSDNGGASYTLLNPGSFSYAVVAPDADRVLLAGPRGILSSDDAGSSFGRVADRDARVALTNADADGATVVAYASRRLIVSTDAGASWRRVLLAKRMFLTDVSFVSAKVGYVVSGGRVWRTANGGRSWTSFGSTGASTVFGIDFADARHGYAIVNRFGAFVAGFLLRTSDGGATWRPQLVAPAALRDVESAGGTDYSLAGIDALYATTSGGDTGAVQSLSLSTRHRTLRKPSAILVTGRLKPADGGELVQVSMRTRRAWAVQVAVVASNGSFSTRWRVRGTSQFVAQVLGDADHAGAATRLLRMTVKRR
jgi:photosystem II stability/assembly factor-like uncharacterized protein